ncbi:MAG: hypothetical protein M3347_08625, partial [Armatimonadota bacterium]|nr:hypothetical protein [Armatimonadota bacterium]
MKALPFSRLLAGASMIVALTVALPATRAVAEQNVVPVLESWPGYRVVMLLPLRVGEGWNADPAYNNLILAQAENRLRTAMTATKKFSVIQPYRFSPLFQRAVIEKRLTQDQVNQLVENPTVENAAGVLEKLGFDYPPLIADFRLEEVRATVPTPRSTSTTASSTSTGSTSTGSTTASGQKESSPKEEPKTEAAPAPVTRRGNPTKAVQVQVSGKLYDTSNRVAVKTAVVTSDSVKSGRSTLERILSAADDAFDQIVTDFVRPPAD